MDEDWRALNRTNWDERTAVHLGSRFYDMSSHRAGRGRLDAIVEAELGPVAGLRVLHLQSHLGDDSVTLVQRGASACGRCARRRPATSASASSRIAPPSSSRRAGVAPHPGRRVGGRGGDPMSDAMTPQAARNIEEILRREEEMARRAPAAARVADRVAEFAGTIAFVALHAALLTFWLAVNLGFVPFIPAFDPYPFPLLAALFSVEGVLLAVFVLIKQNRMGARDEERAHLDLQVSLLAEQEVTKVIQMLERVSTALKIEDQVVDQESRELGRHTAVGHIAQQLHDRLRKDGE